MGYLRLFFTVYCYISNSNNLWISSIKNINHPIEENGNFSLTQSFFATNEATEAIKGARVSRTRITGVGVVYTMLGGNLQCYYPSVMSCPYPGGSIPDLFRTIDVLCWYMYTRRFCGCILKCMVDDDNVYAYICQHVYLLILFLLSKFELEEILLIQLVIGCLTNEIVIF